MSKETFQQYYKRKLIIWVGLGLVAILIRLFGGHETTFAFAMTIVIFSAVAAFIIGYLDYNFYENLAPKIVAKLIDKEPLYSFQNIGFIKQESNKLEGEINNYRIILSPLPNLYGDKILIVLIPLQMREGMDDYFTEFNNNFRLSLSGENVFAEAIIKRYEKEYAYDKLLNLIDKTTIRLKEMKIEPVNIIDD